MKIEKLNFNDTKKVFEVIDMFYDLIHEILPCVAGDKIYFTYEVMYWQKGDVYIAITDDGNIAGFMYGFSTDEGFCKKHYIAEHCYVKHEYRNGKAAYLLYNAIVSRAADLNLTIIGNAYMMGNRVDSILAKFGKPVFLQFLKEA